MCGRFNLRANAAAVAEVLGIADPATLPPINPRYNIAPTQQVLTAGRNAKGEIAAGFMKWGLVPSWAADDKGGAKLINARADGVATKPSFRSAFKKRRCVVPATGYYEWQATGKIKQPYHFHRPDDKPFLFAALWERWGDSLLTCCLITTDANATSEPIHNRMPVILTGDAIAAWLNPDTDAEALQNLSVPAPTDFLTVNAVSRTVSNARKEGPECVAPIAGRQLRVIPFYWKTRVEIQFS